MDAKTLSATILAAALMMTTTAAALPGALPVVDNPLGDWTVELDRLAGDGTSIWNVTFDIHANHDLVGGSGDECFDDPAKEELTLVCGEFAFRVFREASPGGAAVVTFPGDHGTQLDNLDDEENLNGFCDQAGTPICGGDVDEVFGGFAANLCGGPDGEDEQGDAWLHVSAPAGTELYVGAIYETPENFDGNEPDTDTDPCVQTEGDQSDFPGDYTGTSFSETITLS